MIDNLEGLWWATKIYDFIFLGGVDDAKNLQALKQNHITTIINVADNVPNFYMDEFKYLNLNVKDNGEDEGISRIFSRVFNILENRKQEEIFFFHCLSGINRSASLVIATVMKLENWNLASALVFVKSKRPFVAPYIDNVKELLRWEKKLLGFNSVKNTDFELSTSELQPLYGKPRSKFSLIPNIDDLKHILLSPDKPLDIKKRVKKKKIDSELVCKI